MIWRLSVACCSQPMSFINTIVPWESVSSIVNKIILVWQQRLFQDASRCISSQEPRKKHTDQEHNLKISREMMVSNCTVLYKESNIYKLEILEALLILKKGPLINKQDTGRLRTLKLLGWSFEIHSLFFYYFLNLVLWIAMFSVSPLQKY